MSFARARSHRSASTSVAEVAGCILFTMEFDSGGRDFGPRRASAGPLAMIVRVFLGLFALPFFGFGVMMCGGSLVAGLSGSSILASLFGVFFGLPFAAVGGLFLLIAFRGQRAMPERMRRLKGRSLERVQAAMDQSLQEAGLGPGDGEIPRPPARATSGSTGVDFGSCPQCGASVTDASLISPSGDVCCDHCRTWFRARLDANPR